MTPIKSCLSFDSLLPIFVSNQKKKKERMLILEKKEAETYPPFYPIFLMQGGMQRPSGVLPTSLPYLSYAGGPTMSWWGPSHPENWTMRDLPLGSCSWHHLLRSSPSRIQGYPQDERHRRVRERERPDQDVQQSLAMFYFSLQPLYPKLVHF